MSFLFAIQSRDSIRRAEGRRFELRRNGFWFRQKSGFSLFRIAFGEQLVSNVLIQHGFSTSQTCEVWTDHNGL
jgi:hypothetical protein